MKKPGFLFLLLLSCLCSCHVARYIWWNFADIKDYRKFPSREIKKAGPPFVFYQVDTNIRAGAVPRTVQVNGKKSSFEDFLKAHKTVAFLIIKDDTMLYESYFKGYSKSSIVPSFSMAKSYVSALVGIALQEGFLKDVNEPVTNYLTELKARPGFEKITIAHLLDMRSGIRYNEGYFNPFGEVARYYYGRNLRKYVRKLTVRSAADQEFDYISVNTQLLGFILERATGKSLTAYLQEKIWQPLGMEYDASWSLDSRKDQAEKAFCCINARARDFAKFGRLYLNRGSWNGTQVVPASWVDKSVTIHASSKAYFYSYAWWHTSDYRTLCDTCRQRPDEKLYVAGSKAKGNEIRFLQSPSGDFYANGFLGQYIYVYPQKKVIIVRLGKDEDGVNWAELMKNIARSY